MRPIIILETFKKSKLPYSRRFSNNFFQCNLLMRQRRIMRFTTSILYRSFLCFSLLRILIYTLFSLDLLYLLDVVPFSLASTMGKHYYCIGVYFIITA